MNNIILKNVSKEFDGIPVINNICFKFKEGKIYGIIGQNGSGKTMLFSIICGFVKPTSGEVLINDINISKKDCFPTNMRALIETPKFISDLSGYKNLELLASINNDISSNDINSILSKMGLEKFKNVKYSKYSLGMKQKLGIAQVIMENPDIILLDEPFNGLDSQSTKLLKEILLKEKKKNKKKKLKKCAKMSMFSR